MTTKAPGMVRPQPETRNAQSEPIQEPACLNYALAQQVVTVDVELLDLYLGSEFNVSFTRQEVRLRR